ncbi:MAG: glycoside hydrolase family 99-like domain-containing protein [bacterium]
MKIYALYLPQFHKIPENNSWWGEGFTEWVNVKAAKPLFKNHKQPRVPLNEDYYDLEDADVLKKQFDLAREYGISGFCFYHYWFNGKLLLEKPVEKLLQNKDIKAEYFFSWANEPWTRAWDGKTGVVLIPQEYGKEREWLLHYNYLKDFFIDPRYLKINNCPVFVIYKTKSIEDLNSMLNYINSLAIKDGFGGIHFIKTNTQIGEVENRYDFKNTFDFEPLLTFSTPKNIFEKTRYHLRNLVVKINPFGLGKKFQLSFHYFDRLWRIILNRKIDKNKFLGAFVDWDNTPRKNFRGTVVSNASPKKFQNYLTQQIKRSLENNLDILFINAWNEWAEGAYLEPDKKDGLAYLQAVKSSLEANGIKV